MQEYGHFINGKSVRGKSGRHSDVFLPMDGSVQAKVDLATKAEINEAVKIAAEAQPAWAAINPQRRSRVLRKFLTLVEEKMKPLSELLAKEHGKTVSDAAGDIQRGLEVVELSLGVPHLTKGEFTEGAGPGIDTYSIRQPLGVVAGITPFNFPAMIPLWMAGPAIACGNAFILKPSERDPGVPLRLAELFIEAGGPAGIFNVVNGDKDAVNAILDNPDIKAVSFVGSTPIARYIYERAAVVTKEAQQRILNYVDIGVKEGAKLVVDGRNFKLPGYENGFYVGPCLFDNVTNEMQIYKEEIFGPVLGVIRAKNYEEALALPTTHLFGNGATIFTRDGDAARDFVSHVEVGMVGVNVPIPTPVAYYTFGGWKASIFGDLNQHGPDAFRFFTRTKTVTSRWPSGIRSGAEFSMPTMK